MNEYEKSVVLGILKDTATKIGLLDGETINYSGKFVYPKGKATLDFKEELEQIEEAIGIMEKGLSKKKGKK
ncbi:MAG: hypothetical protein WC783_02970 [Candidatus Paceibacterota bacterium]|jgi:hypothetical protein